MNLSKKQILYKTIFDGYDYIRTLLGYSIIPKELHLDIITTTYVKELYDNADSFIKYCTYNKDGYLPQDLMVKYNCGRYSISNLFDDSNPWIDKEYILFNKKQITTYIQEISEGIKEISFWVCPAYNEDSICEAIGFRIVEQELVDKAFKWLFPCGNNIIYGKNTVDKNKPCYVVEGFRDYVALNESGVNAIGLGSVKISKKQHEYLSMLKEPIISFDNDNFGMRQTLAYKDRYKIAFMTNEEKDPWEAYIKGIDISFVEVV